MRWTGAAGEVVIHAVRRWRPARVEPLADGWTGGLAVLRSALEPLDVGLPAGLLAGGAAEPAPGLARRLLGLGPGLTPSGDDLLAGLLLGARAFGVPLADLAEVIAEQAPRRTTALSARLLRHAIEGECVPEAAALVAGSARRR